jgi:beta-amylase
MRLLLALLALAALAACKYVDVNVMLQLDLVSDSGAISNYDHLKWQFQTLKAGGVDGVMMDVWWGLTEPQEKQYNFSAYTTIVELAQSIGLKVQLVTSFHRCGGNVGDNCNIPLPGWLLNLQGSYSSAWYTDQWGHRDFEYINLAVDEQKIFNGRSPVDMYADWFAALAAAMKTYLTNGTINEIQVGLGPCGELRYPSYQLDRWSFPGVGAFQCWDNQSLTDLRDAACAAGNCGWASPPTDAGGYSSKPSDTSFFSNGWNSDYGKFFLEWYSGRLIHHADVVLAKAAAVFAPYKNHGVNIAAKVAGIHWWFLSQAHSAELTAGYYNTYFRDGYTPIASTFKAHGGKLDFTCLEMRDAEQSAAAQCGPEELVAEVFYDVSKLGATVSGENALERYDWTAYSTIMNACKQDGKVCDAFTYLRLSDNLLSGNNFNTFKSFVAQMHNL